MTLREVTVLIRLFEACRSVELRRWALTQLPELNDVALPPPLEEHKLQRYHIMAYAQDRPAYPIGSNVIVCWPDELTARCAAYARTFDLATSVEVKAEVL